MISLTVASAVRRILADLLVILATALL